MKKLLLLPIIICSLFCNGQGIYRKIEKSDSFRTDLVYLDRGTLLKPYKLLDSMFISNDSVLLFRKIVWNTGVADTLYLQIYPENNNNKWMPYKPKPLH